MDTSSLDPAGESLLNAGSEELGRFDGPPTDLKLEAVPLELVCESCRTLFHRS